MVMLEDLRYTIENWDFLCKTLSSLLMTSLIV